MESDDASMSETLSNAEALSGVMANLEARSQRFGTALTGALRSATAGGKGLEDVLRGLGNRLADIALSAGLKPLQGLIGDAVGSALGSVSPLPMAGWCGRRAIFPWPAAPA